MNGLAKQTENFGQQLAALIARLMCDDSDDEAYPGEEEGLADMVEVRELLQDLREKIDIVVIKEVARLHNELGHLLPPALADHLQTELRLGL